MTGPDANGLLIERKAKYGTGNYQTDVIALEWEFEEHIPIKKLAC